MLYPIVLITQFLKCLPGKSQEDIQIKLNGDLQHIHNWLLANKLTLNIDKSEYMIVGSRQRLSNIIDNPVISIGEQNIKRVTTSNTFVEGAHQQLK